MAENSDDIPLFPRYQPETERRLVTRKGVTCDWEEDDPLTPMSDQARISPYNIITVSTR